MALICLVLSSKYVFLLSLSYRSSLVKKTTKKRDGVLCRARCEVVASKNKARLPATTPARLSVVRNSVVQAKGHFALEYENFGCCCSLKMDGSEMGSDLHKNLASLFSHSDTSISINNVYLRTHTLLTTQAL